ncbi:hypothetical protein ABZ639_30585 [Saccharomonospora sp. NPDC006951]
MAAHAMNDRASGVGSFEADPGRLSVLAADFAGFAERVDTISARLRTALARTAGGTDGVGPFADALDRIDAIETELAGTGEALAGAAAAYRDADNSAAIEVADTIAAFSAAEGGAGKPGDPGRAG